MRRIVGGWAMASASLSHREMGMASAALSYLGVGMASVSLSHLEMGMASASLSHREMLGHRGMLGCTTLLPERSRRQQGMLELKEMLG